jgi:transposase
MRINSATARWNVIRPMLPNKARGMPRVDDRRRYLLGLAIRCTMA